MDAYSKLNLKRVINASGKMSILGVSKVKDNVIDAQTFGGKHFFEMSELMKESAAYISKLLNVEDTAIVASASAGIAQSVSAIIGMDNDYHLMHPYTDKITKREIILPKGHNVNFGSSIELMVQVGGGVIIEAGYANECSVEQVEMNITENTAALFYVKSHHSVQKSILTIQAMQTVADKHNLPLIIDAAAEEDLSKFYNTGATLVIYSGAKALEGPSSGFVVGRKPYVERVRLQSKGLGRTMKIGKENVLGLVSAIEHYLETPQESGTEMTTRLEPFIQTINNIPHLNAKVVQDAAGRDIYRAQVKVLDKLTAIELIDELKQGDTAIYTREYQANNGIIEFDIRSVNESEMQIIIKTLKNIMEAK